MANPFDQFDAKAANPFDQFDATPAPAAPASRSVGQILLDNLAATPGRMVDKAKQDAQSLASFVSDFKKPSVALPTVVAGPPGALAGPVAQAATRTALGAAPHVLPGALARIVGATTGGTMEEGVKGGLKAGGQTAAAEAAFPIVSKVLRSLPGEKTRASERLSHGVSGVMSGVAPEMRAPIAAAKAGVAPGTAGRTAAALEEVALGESGKQAAGQIMEKGMLDATLAAGGQGVSSPALQTAWRRMPTGLDSAGNVTDELAYRLWTQLSPSPKGTFTVSQAERLLAELGDAAFKGEAASPIARGIGGLELRKLYQQALEQTVTGLPGQSAQVFAEARDKFKGVTSLLDMLRAPGTRQGFPNRVMLNEPKLQKYASENRAEMRTKLGPAFDALENALYHGGQLGTRSLMAPGTGETMAALNQVYGRGQGGAPQMIGSALRTAAPNLGSQPTGQPAYSLPQALRTLLETLGIRQTVGGPDAAR